MSRPHRGALAALIAVHVLLPGPIARVAAIRGAPAARAAREQAPARDTPTIPVDVVALDGGGHLARQLTAAEFSVTVDGSPRRVVWVRYVSRGPGASREVEQLQASGSTDVTFATEPIRNVLILVDESSIPRGSERPILEAAGMLTDRLGLEDRLAIVRFPAGERRVALTTDRPEARAELRKIAGQGERARMPVEEPPLPEPATPDAAPGGEPGRPPDEPVRPAVPDVPSSDVRARKPSEEEDAAFTHDLAFTLESMLNTLRSTEGRKIIAIFSGGLTEREVSRLEQVAAAAIAANATIYSFGAQGVQVDTTRVHDLNALERLATATGGTFARLGKKVDKSIAGVLTEIAGRYVLGVERAASDVEGKRRALRVEVRVPQVTLRVPAFFVPRDDVDDVVPLVPVATATGSVQTRAPTSGGTAARPAAPALPRGGGSAAASAVTARDAELERLLARASEYVEGYEREYSLLVAEERFYQSWSRQTRTIRSDLLLVRPSDEEGWLSFRDVFEVDGRPVRDRDDRLKRLFLDKSPEAQAALGGIRAESSRFNIGPVARNINVPLFPLEFLRADNLARFRFRLAGDRDVRGVNAHRVAYEEVTRPTIVYYNDEPNLPSRGWFLVDPVSGAVVGSLVEFDLGSTVDKLILEVEYQRDEVLGMWVPGEMSEVYWRYSPARRNTEIVMDARATYSKFRRFRVTTEEKIDVPK